MYSFGDCYTLLEQTDKMLRMCKAPFIANSINLFAVVKHLLLRFAANMDCLQASMFYKWVKKYSSDFSALEDLQGSHQQHQTFVVVIEAYKEDQVQNLKKACLKNLRWRDIFKLKADIYEGWNAHCRLSI